MKPKPFFVILLASLVALPLLICLLLGKARLVVKPGAVSIVDEKLAQLAVDGVFSGAVLIAQDDKVLLSQGYGLANRAQGIPNTPQTRFHLGSMTKQFTALGIMILEAQDKLSFYDPICSYFASCPTAWKGITIHHLLTHTSGLSSRLSNQLYREIEAGSSSLATAPVSRDEQAKYLGLTSEWPAGARPGEKYAYNNFGYVLLTHIIEQASGQSYADFLKRTIFKPLNLHNTGYQERASEVANVHLDKEDVTGTQFDSPLVSDGSDYLYSSVEDLMLWIQALNRDQLLPQAKLAPMFERYTRETDLPPFGYGYGSFVANILGRPVQMATGGGRLFVTISFHFPVDGLTLIVLTNQGAPDYIAMMLAIIGDIASALFFTDLVFALSAIACMLLLAILLVAKKNCRVNTPRQSLFPAVIEILWLLLAAPLALVFTRYLAEGRNVCFLLPLSLVLLFMLTKALLDFLFRIDFRRKRFLRLAYPVLMSLALSSLVGIAFSIHPSWGIPLLIAFGMLAISLFYMDRIGQIERHTVVQDTGELPVQPLALRGPRNLRLLRKKRSQ